MWSGYCCKPNNRQIIRKCADNLWNFFDVRFICAYSSSASLISQSFSMSLGCLIYSQWTELIRCPNFFYREFFLPEKWNFFFCLKCWIILNKNVSRRSAELYNFKSDQIINSEHTVAVRILLAYPRYKYINVPLSLIDIINDTS